MVPYLTNPRHNHGTWSDGHNCVYGRYTQFLPRPSNKPEKVC